MSRRKQLGDRYRIGEVLGQGSFSTVYYCEDITTSSRAQYAVKVISKAEVQQQGMEEAVERELAAMKMVAQKPSLYVTNPIEILQSSRNFYVIMEVADGGTLLRKIISTNGGLPMHVIRKYFRQLLQGLKDIHDCGVVHRDIKPENLLLDDYRNLRIADFSFACCADAQRVLKRQCGTPHYVAPDVLRGKGYNGRCADVWSTGITLYVMVFGQMPFVAPDTDRLYERISAGRYKFPSSPDNPSRVSTALKHLISVMLRVDPAKRWTLEKIARHPWLFGHDELPQTPRVPRHLFPAPPGGGGLNISPSSPGAVPSGLGSAFMPPSPNSSGTQPGGSTGLSVSQEMLHTGSMKGDFLLGHTPVILNHGAHHDGLQKSLGLSTEQQQVPSFGGSADQADQEDESDPAFASFPLRCQAFYSMPDIRCNAFAPRGATSTFNKMAVGPSPVRRVPSRQGSGGGGEVFKPSSSFAKKRSGSSQERSASRTSPSTTSRCFCDGQMLWCVVNVICVFIVFFLLAWLQLFFEIRPESLPLPEKLRHWIEYVLTPGMQTTSSSSPVTPTATVMRSPVRPAPSSEDALAHSFGSYREGAPESPTMSFAESKNKSHRHPLTRDDSNLISSPHVHLNASDNDDDLAGSLQPLGTSLHPQVGDYMRRRRRVLTPQSSAAPTPRSPVERGSPLNVLSLRSASAGRHNNSPGSHSGSARSFPSSKLSSSASHLSDMGDSDSDGHVPPSTKQSNPLLANFILGRRNRHRRMNTPSPARHSRTNSNNIHVTPRPYSQAVGLRRRVPSRPEDASEAGTTGSGEVET